MMILVSIFTGVIRNQFLVFGMHNCHATGLMRSVTGNAYQGKIFTANINNVPGVDTKLHCLFSKGWGGG